MSVRSTLLQLKIPCVWLFGPNHWMKAGVKPNNMVIPILTVHCLNHIFRKRLTQWWLIYWRIYASLGLNELKHQEHSHAFYRVTPNICIIYRMRNDFFVDCSQWLLTSLGTGCHKWLNRPFCVGIDLGRCTSPSTVFHNHMTKNDHLRSFLCFKSERLFRMNLMHGKTDGILHVPILTWPCMTSSPTSHGSESDITQHFSLNSFLLLSFGTKMSHLKRWYKVLRANQCYGNLPFISIPVLQKDSITENISMDIFSSKFYQKYYNIRYIKWCKC